MMRNRIDASFSALHSRDSRALLAYITAGDPDLEFTAPAVEALVAGGADIIELGLPFSDPLADGSVIQEASMRSLAGGFRVAHIFRLVQECRERVDVPLMVMSYYNPLLQFGLSEFCQELSCAGGDGLLVPDLPLEEEGELREAARECGLRTAAFVAPTSTDERVRRLEHVRDGFVYCVSVTGTTGTSSPVSERVRSLVSRVREHSPVPVVVGFGISQPEHVAAVGEYADGAVIGSRFVRVTAELAAGERSRDGALEELERLAGHLHSGFGLSTRARDC